MEKEILEKWEKIYDFAQMITAYDPWKLFEEDNVFAFVPKGTRDEHYFSFLAESCGQYGIALYPNGAAYVAARCRLRGQIQKRNRCSICRMLSFCFGETGRTSAKRTTH